MWREGEFIDYLLEREKEDKRELYFCSNFLIHFDIEGINDFDVLIWRVNYQSMQTGCFLQSFGKSQNAYAEYGIKFICTVGTGVYLTAKNGRLGLTEEYKESQKIKEEAKAVAENVKGEPDHSDEEQFKDEDNNPFINEFKSIGKKKKAYPKKKENNDEPYEIKDEILGK